MGPSKELREEKINEFLLKNIPFTDIMQEYSEWYAAECMKDSMQLNWPDNSTDFCGSYYNADGYSLGATIQIIRPKPTPQFKKGETIFISCAGPQPVVAVITDVNPLDECPYLIDYFGKTSPHRVSNNHKFTKKFDPKYIGQPWDAIP
jgi:hypothetical protein